jgi:hypothetical protein
MQTEVLVVVVLLILWLLISLYSTKVYRFYKPTCKYCVESQDEWDRFKQNCKFRLIRCIDIDTSNANGYNEMLAQNFGVKTVPAVFKVEPDGRREMYDGERQADAYMAWCTK